MSTTINPTHTLPKRVIFFLCVVLSASCLFYLPSNILAWDVFGYYLYLPLTFIYHDLGLKHFDTIKHIIDTYHNTSTFYQGSQMPSGAWVMKYTSGMSIMYSPFFFIGHLVAKLFNYPADGFSQPYQYAMLIGSMLYTFTGISFLAKILVKYFTATATSIVLIVIVLGTNYLLHTSIHGQGLMSHNYLFTLYTIIVWNTIKWHEEKKVTNIIYLGMACGMAALSRPTEIISVLIPLLWGIYNFQSIKEKMQLLIAYKYQITTFVLLLVSIGSIQLIYWKIYTDSFFFNSYNNPAEGLDFLTPYIAEILFSFRKGWLIYTPVMIFALVGFYWLYKKNKNIFFSCFIYTVLNIYIVGSWTCWWYAGSFSQRALIPSYVVLSLPLGYFIESLLTYKKYAQVVFGSIILFFISLNLFQSWQMTQGILDISRNSREYYFSVFGKTHVTDEDRKLLLVDRPIEGNARFNESDYFKVETILSDYEAIGNDTVYYNIHLSHAGSSSLVLDNNNIFSPSLTRTFAELTSKSHVWLKVTAWVYPLDDPKTNPTSLVVSFHHKEWPYQYRTIDIENQELKLNQWNEITMYYITPEVRSKSDNLGVYFWYRGKTKIFVDDVKVEVYEPKFDSSVF